jgi:hypothetical protein
MGQVALILIVTAALGIVVGYRRAWWLAWLGAAAGGALVVVSRLASNNGVYGSEDLGWRTALVLLGVLVAAGFYVGLLLGAAIVRVRDAATAPQRRRRGADTTAPP